MSTARIVTIGDIDIGGAHPFALITGPCQLESLDHARMMAERIAAACAPTGTKFIFKASYDKANRSSINTKRGLGMDEGLSILSKIRDEYGCPVLTDVHDARQCAPAAQACDVLQIPAFLCRQTDLLLAAGETGAAINVKKGQFLAPWDMGNVAEKIASTGNARIMLCDRGTWSADNGANGLPRGVRRHAFGAATRRAGGDKRRAARIRAGAGTRGLCGGRVGAVY